MSFKELNLHPNILKAIQELGYETPTPIQKNAIPHILNKKDLCASAQTGTGKTAAFLLPILNNLIELKNDPNSANKKGPFVLILAPTRELADQISKECIKYTKYLQKVKTVCIYGGMPYPKQRRDLSSVYEILVATPGRLIDHLERGKINLSKITTFVLDEADRMLDMGFIEPVREIASSLPENRQTLLFSATLKDSVIDLVKDIQNDPVKIKISIEHKNIEQRIHKTFGLDHKHKLLSHLLNDSSINQAIIFTATKSYADELNDRLRDEGFRAEAIHGDISQQKRLKIIKRFREGQIRYLIATDVAARGIDIQQVSHIINFDLPRCFDDYVHRIGRTGRIGAKGIAFSFATSKDFKIVKEIEKKTGNKMTKLSIPDFQDKDSFKEKNNGFREDKKFNKFDKKRRKFKNFKDEEFEDDPIDDPIDTPEDDPVDKPDDDFEDKPNEKKSSNFKKKNNFQGRKSFKNSDDDSFFDDFKKRSSNNKSRFRKNRFNRFGKSRRRFDDDFHEKKRFENKMSKKDFKSDAIDTSEEKHPASNSFFERKNRFDKSKRFGKKYNENNKFHFKNKKRDHKNFFNKNEKFSHKRKEREEDIFF